MNARRHRTWSDLEDIVAYLLKEKLTHPSLLFLSTNSAGAIAVWNAINRAPHLYKGVILYYPFLDILSALLDSSQPLTHSDHGEFGNPITSKRVYM